MSYQVWTKDEFTGWQRADAESLEAAKEQLLIALKKGLEPVLTIELPFNMNIDIKEGKPVETTKTKTEPGEGAGAEGEGKVRRGSTKGVSEQHP